MISARVELALVVRLQVDQEAAAVERRVGAVDADERAQALDVRILEDRGGERLLALRPWPRRRSICGASEMPWITPVSCTGKKPLGMTT
jgi:hypothetical protein